MDKAQGRVGIRRKVSGEVLSNDSPTKERDFQFTFKNDNKDLMCKDYRTRSYSADEALKSFNINNPGAVFIAMWDNTEL